MGESGCWWAELFHLVGTGLGESFLPQSRNSLSTRAGSKQHLHEGDHLVKNLLPLVRLSLKFGSAIGG